MKYIDLLTSNSASIDDLSLSLKKRHKEILQLTQELADAEERLKDTTLAKNLRENLTTQVAEGKELLQSNIDELFDKIKKNWLPNREKYAQLAEHLKGVRTNRSALVAARKNNTAATVVDPPADPAPAPEPAAPVDLPPAAPTPVNTPASTEPAATPATEPKKKEGSVSWGWVGLAAATVIGIFFGVKYYNNR